MYRMTIRALNKQKSDKSAIFQDKKKQLVPNSRHGSGTISLRHEIKRQSVFDGDCPNFSFFLLEMGEFKIVDCSNNAVKFTNKNARKFGLNLKNLTATVVHI